MKTPEEVIEWLKNQGIEFYKKFCQNVIRFNEGHDNFCQNLSKGLYGIGTIEVAFPWDKTEQGSKFWSKINDEFVEWYNDKFDDLM